MQRQEQNQNPLIRGKKNGKNFLAATAPSCRQKTVDRAVVVIDGMTIGVNLPPRAIKPASFEALSGAAEAVPFQGGILSQR